MGKLRLVERIRRRIRQKNYSYRTEQAYVRWVVRFIKFCGLKYPTKISTKEIEQYINYLAVERHVAASTQNQALCAILFLYKEVLEKPLPELQNIQWANRPHKLPVVLTRSEVKRLFNHLKDIPLLVAKLLYGSGLRISEAIRIRVKDVDFGYNQLVIRDGKGRKDRLTVLPKIAVSDLKKQIHSVKILHERDLQRGHGAVRMPKALDRKYPKAAHDIKWQYVFPSHNISNDPRSQRVHRHHISDTFVQRAVRRAVRQAGFAKQASCHTLRHSFATHLPLTYWMMVTTSAQYKNCWATKM